MGGRRTALILRLALHTPPSSRTAGTVGLFSRRFGGRRERARSSLALGTKAAHAVLGRSRSPLGMTQSIIDSMYNTLLRDTLGQVDAHMLLPAEQCYLLRGHHLPQEASLSINATSCKEAVECWPQATARQKVQQKSNQPRVSVGSQHRGSRHQLIALLADCGRDRCCQRLPQFWAWAWRCAATSAASEPDWTSQRNRCAVQRVAPCAR